METCPGCCQPLAKMLTTTEQMMQVNVNWTFRSWILQFTNMPLISEKELFYVKIDNIISQLSFMSYLGLTAHQDILLILSRANH